jgi:RNA polymerase sigma-70 factor (ECF subfamily)
MNSSYEERGEQLRFLYTIARNLCIDESRKAKMEELTEDYSGDGDEAEDLIRKIDVNSALDKMPEEDRELLILRYMNEVPLSDICKIMGVSRFALYRKLNSVKRDFIKLMEGGNFHE